LIAISRFDRFNPVGEDFDFLDLPLGKQGLTIAESVTQRNFAGASPSPKRLPRNV
jgi:hypothetical protein